MKLLTVILSMVIAVLPSVKPYLKALQQRDSVLVGDQFECGFEISGLEYGIEPKPAPAGGFFKGDTLVLVRDWRIDTLRNYKKKQFQDIRLSVVFAPFEEGTIVLPRLRADLCRENPFFLDSLFTETDSIEVSVMPVDTTTFEIKDIREPVRYPLTFEEVLPWAGGLLALAAIIAAIVMLVRKYRNRKASEAGPADPAYIVALRQLEHFRNEKYWEPEKQKQFYSGITDALKFYIGDRFGFDAPEMTTSELFEAMARAEKLPGDLTARLRELFETADFVKFAKHYASKEQNETAVPSAVKFIMSTCQKEEENVL